MIDLSPQPTTEEKVNGSDSPAPGEMGELRDILLAEEREKIANLQRRLDDPKTYVEQLSNALPESIHLRTKRDKALTKALAPTVEESLNASVRRNPRAIADAIFPIMGPAIRKAISTALRELFQSLNQALEYSFSVKGMKWRLEAWRTGKSFAEVVVSHTLLYRVEHVFLIHRETGLLLEHVADDSAVKQDADMISGMLTANQDFMRDFVRDAFGEQGGSSLNVSEVGDLKFWFEQSPRAILAAVIRGNAPEEYRLTLQDAIESIHLEFADELENFEGDTAPFERTRPILESCLQTKLGEQGEKKSTPLVWALAGLLGCLFVALCVWWFLAARRDARFDSYLKELSSRPGLVVVDYGKRDGKYFVTGLRDLLAEDPGTIMRAKGIDPQTVISHWENYQSSQAEFVLLRANKILRPPPGVTLAFQDGVLSASGIAPDAWITDAQRLSSMIPAVTGFQNGGLIAQELKDRIEKTMILFDINSAKINADQNELLQRLALDLRRLDAALRGNEKKVSVVIAGYADESGTAETNMRLQQERAENVSAALREQGVTNLLSIEWKIMNPLENPTRENERKVTLKVEYANP